VKLDSTTYDKIFGIVLVVNTRIFMGMLDEVDNK